MLAATLVDNLCEEIGWNLATYQTNIYWYACQLKCPLSNSQCRPIVPNVHQPSGRSRPSDKGVGWSSSPWEKGGHIFGPQFGLKIREGSPWSATASANRYLATKLHRPACQLLVCTWRHGSHVGGQERKHFSPLGTNLYFHVNSLRKYSFVLTPNMATLSHGCKPRIVDQYTTTNTLLLLDRRFSDINATITTNCQC